MFRACGRFCFFIFTGLQPVLLQVVLSGLAGLIYIIFTGVQPVLLQIVLSGLAGLIYIIFIGLQPALLQVVLSVLIRFKRNRGNAPTCISTG